MNTRFVFRYLTSTGSVHRSPLYLRKTISYGRVFEAHGKPSRETLSKFVQRYNAAGHLQIVQCEIFDTKIQRTVEV